MLRYIKTFVAVAIGALVMVAGAVAGKPDIVKFPPVELVGLSQHDCGDYELLLSGTLERMSRFTLDEAGQDVAERRQVKITGTIYNSSDPSKAAPYFRSIQIDSNFVTGERAIIGTTHVVVRGQSIVFQTSGIRIEDWTDVDFETVFPTLLFQGGPADTFDDEAWNRLCSALS
jgi:hypothetical protein